jgi:hypothetical protein
MWEVTVVTVDDVQRTTPGTSGSVGERRDGRRVAAVDDDGGSGGGGQGVGIIIILWLEMCGRRALRQESESS